MAAEEGDLKGSQAPRRHVRDGFQKIKLVEYLGVRKEICMAVSVWSGVVYRVIKYISYSTNAKATPGDTEERQEGDHIHYMAQP